MNLITGEVLNYFTGIFSNHFDTFSANTNIVVFKEPLKVVVDSSSGQEGYGDYGNINETYTYIPVSGSFPALKVIGKIENDTFSVHSDTRNPESEIKIKVKKDAKDYIENGKTLNILLNGEAYNDISSSELQNYFGLHYWYFTLKKTN